MKPNKPLYERDRKIESPERTTHRQSKPAIPTMAPITLAAILFIVILLAIAGSGSKPKSTTVRSPAPPTPIVPERKAIADPEPVAIPESTVPVVDSHPVLVSPGDHEATVGKQLFFR